MLEGLNLRYPSSPEKSGLGLSCKPPLHIQQYGRGLRRSSLEFRAIRKGSYICTHSHAISWSQRRAQPSSNSGSPSLSQTGRHECPLLHVGGGKRRAMVRGDFGFLCYHHCCIRNLPLQPRRAGWQPGWQHRALQRVLVCVCEREGEGRDVHLAGNAAPRS